MKRSILILILTFIVGIGFAENVLPAKFHVDINTMEPMRYPSKDVNGYLFDVRNDTAYVSLPYIGEVFAPDYDSDGLNFRSPMVIKETKILKDGAQSTAFTIDKNGNRFDMRMTAYSNGTFYLDLQPSNGDLCRYVGQWEALKE